MKFHQHFEFEPASQDPFSFCQIQLALDTVYRQKQWRPLMYSLPNILYSVHVLMWFSHPHVCDQLLWINGYSCTYAFLIRGGPNTSTNFISICIIIIFPTLPDYSKYFWPGSVITQGVGAGGMIATIDTTSRAGIFKKSMGARNLGGIGLSYWPARLHRLAEFIRWNQFRGPINI